MKINKKIEATLLKGNMIQEDIDILIASCNKYKFHGICVPSLFLRCGEKLNKSRRLITVANFPFSSLQPTGFIRSFYDKYKRLMEEIDIVAPYILMYDNRCFGLLEKWFNRLRNHIKIPIKIIIETGYFNEQQIHDVSRVIANSGIDFVKTCTGFGPRGVTIGDIRIIKRAIKGTKCKIKASGGIKTRKFAENLINAGADRLGVSNYLKVMDKTEE